MLREQRETKRRRTNLSIVMKAFDAKHIKNVVLLGAHGSGKTTLAEPMLFDAGLITRRGRVEVKNTGRGFNALEH